MDTEILSTENEQVTRETVSRAVATLRTGGIVALPTETVYGLGADALDPAAVAKIFEAKDRPHFDPLIVHLPNKTMVRDVAEVPQEIAKTVTQLVETFWPGPLTILLPKKPIVPDLVTAGLPTVAVRQCEHPIFHRILKHFGGPVAAPSANLFGCLSPTSAALVRDQLDGRIPLIVDGGACARGLESTIVRIVPGTPKPIIEVLRPGPIAEDDLKPFGKVVFAKRNEAVEDSAPEAPGRLASHYAPRTPLRLLEHPRDFSPEPGKRYALLSYRGQEKDGYLSLHEWAEVAVLSPGSGRVAEAGIRLFHLLGQLDKGGFDEIIAEPVPERGVGRAILDKLRKAAVKS
ncbi:MAG TPA: L-threonylcarbamoyladenylate synthase [Bacteroidia bacterium]|nr:L-threonylcarbamoyladenylate synthase [Bacteroidia bacterium]